MSYALLPAEIADRVVIPIDQGCWTWRGTISAYGYGQVHWEGRTHGAHRVVYELLVGEIAKGLWLDHLCRNTACVNPAHLEQVTPGENLRRGHEHRRAMEELRRVSKARWHAAHRIAERSERVQWQKARAHLGLFGKA